MNRIAIQLSYDGADFCGWQTQRGRGKHKCRKPAVEEKVQAAIQELCSEKVQLVSSGRTDAGVHASGQVAHFDLSEISFSEQNLLRGLNNLLPEAIQIHQLGRVPETFRAQNSSRKQYSYYFQQGPARIPHLRNYTMWDRYSLDGEAMQAALQQLVGEHDFAGYSSARARVSSTIRTIYEAEVTRCEIPLPGFFDPEISYLWRVRIVGSGFLKQMVRGIAGTLRQIGEKRRPVDDSGAILESKDRHRAGPTAPAGGLWLDRVWYSPQPGIDFLDQV